MISIASESISVTSKLCDTSLFPVSLPAFVVICFFTVAILPVEHLFVWGKTPFLLSVSISQFQLRAGIHNQVIISPSMLPFHHSNVHTSLEPGAQVEAMNVPKSVEDSEDSLGVQ